MARGLGLLRGYRGIIVAEAYGGNDPSLDEEIAAILGEEDAVVDLDRDRHHIGEVMLGVRPEQTAVRQRNASAELQWFARHLGAGGEESAVQASSTAGRAIPGSHTTRSGSTASPRAKATVFSADCISMA